MSSPLAPTALGNAVADVLSLSHDAISINSFNSLGYTGNGNIGSYTSPTTKVTLTVFVQYNSVTASGISNSLVAAVSALQNGFSYLGSTPNPSPLAIALKKYSFPNAGNVYYVGVSTTSSSSYPTPSASPSTTGPTVLSPTKSPAPLVFTGAPSPLIPALQDARFDLPSLGSLTTCLLFVSFYIFYHIVIAS